MHHGAQIGELAVIGPLFLFFLIIGGHVAEQGIAVIRNDVVGEIADEAFEAVFELVA